MSTLNTVEVFLGKHIDVPGEQQFLARLQRDLQTLGVSARILANLQIGRLGDRQVDFVIVTEHRTMVVELKTYPGQIVRGPRNGPWTVQVGEVRVEQRGNPLLQVLSAAQHFSDELHAFAKHTQVPGPSRSSRSRGAKFYSDLDAVACVFPEVPADSTWEPINHTSLLGYDDVLARLQCGGPSLQWTPDHWDQFVRRLNLYRVDEETPENIVRRAGAAVIDTYAGLYREAHQSTGPIAATAVRVAGAEEARPDVATLVTSGATVLLRGASGTGKTLWAQATATELAAAGHLPIWIQPDMCDGTFLTACAQAIAPYTAQNVNELIKAADVSGRTVVFIVDDLGRVSGEGRRRLIEGLRTLRVRGTGRGLLVTDQQAEHACELGDCTDIELPVPEGDDRTAVLAIYGHGDLIDRCGAFSTPFELSIAAACADELGREATRAELLDLYVDQRVGGNAVSRGALRRIASYMYTELRPFPRRGEVTQRLRRQKMTDEQIQALYDCDLLALSGGRLAFRHEQFEQFLATEALLSDVEDASEVARRLNAPRAAGLRRNAIALEGDRDRLETILASCEDATVLAEAGLGRLGHDAAEAADAVFSQVLRDACARTTASGISLQFTGDEFHHCRWQVPTATTKAQNAALHAIGQLLLVGRYTDQVDTLIRHTDVLVARAVDEAEPGMRNRIESVVFAATYAFDQPDGLPANPLVMAVTHRAFAFIPSDGERKAQAIDRLVGDVEQAGHGAIWLAAHLMHDPHVPIRADIIIRCLYAGPYHMRLFGLTVAEDRGGRLTAAARRKVIDAVEALPTNNILLNSSISEALSSLGALEPIKTAEDIESDIAAVLAMRGDPLADRMAYGILSSQFEADLVGPYFLVVSDLDPDDHVQLLAMALNGSEHGDLTDDWILSELPDLVAPESRSAVVAWVGRTDPKSWVNPQGGISATVSATTLLATADLELPASVNGQWEPEWKGAMELMMVAAAGDYAAISAGWKRFAAEHPDAVASLVINLRNLDMWERDRLLPDRLKQAIPAEVIDILVRTVEHPEQAVSLTRWDHDLRRHVVTALGQHGNRSAARALRRFADDPEIGREAAEAVREIEARPA